MPFELKRHVLTLMLFVLQGALDLFAKPVFGALLIWGHRGIDPARLGLHIHDYDEKDVAVHERKNGHSNGVTNGSAAAATNGEQTV